MTGCHAKFCPEDELAGNNFFCSYHWDILPQISKDKLASAYGTQDWPRALKSAIQDLILVEGDLRGLA